MLKSFYHKWGNLSLALFSVAIILFVLFWSDNVGVSDNGDFTRVMSATNLTFIEERELFIITENLNIDLSDGNFWSNLSKVLFETETLEHYPSIHILFVRISIAINMFINLLTGSALSLYRVSVLAIIYTLCYVAVLFFLFRQISLKNTALDLISKLIIIVVLCDVGYIAYFNSLYSEPVQILGLVWLVACAMRLLKCETPSAKDMLLFAAAAVLYGWSKFANIPGACLIIAGFAVIAGMKKNKMWILPVSLVPIALLAAIYIYVPPSMDLQTNFNSVFFGIVKDVDEDTAISYLEELGLPPETMEFAAQNYYGDGVKGELESSEHYEAITGLQKTDLLIFYLKHPSLLFSGVRTSIENSAFIRPFYLGNYNASHPRLTFSNRFAVWSNIRIGIGTGSTLGNAAIVLAFTAIMILYMLKSKDRSYLIAMLVILCLLLYNAIIPIIANGEGDLAKHMFAYVQIIDIVILSVLISGLNACGQPGKPLIPIIATVMSLALLTDPLISLASNVTLMRKNHSTLEKGSYISLGSYGGDRQTWLVTSKEDGIVTLICTSNITSTEFDSTNSSYWKDSSIRRWLNSEFLRSFSAEEQTLLLETENTYLLSGKTKDLSESGDRDFYCFHTPAYASRGADRAYSARSNDTVSLPDISMVSGLNGAGYDISGNYWLETPYFGNGSMVRYVANDGYIYMRDAKEACGIRPVIHISSDTEVSGNGNQSSPLYIDTK